MKNKKENKFKEIMKQFMRVMHKYMKLEETPMDFGSGDMLYRAEIHTIEAIAKNHPINITKLAEKLEITKGTVSELISKLARKGLVEKKKGNQNDKEVLVELTERGNRSFEGHQEFQNEIYRDFTKIYKNVSLKQLDTFEDVLIAINSNIDKYLHKKSIRKNIGPKSFTDL